MIICKLVKFFSLFSSFQRKIQKKRKAYQMKVSTMMESKHASWSILNHFSIVFASWTKGTCITQEACFLSVSKHECNPTGRINDKPPHHHKNKEGNKNHEKKMNLSVKHINEYLLHKDQNIQRSHDKLFYLKYTFFF